MCSFIVLMPPLRIYRENQLNEVSRCQSSLQISINWYHAWVSAIIYDPSGHVGNAFPASQFIGPITTRHTVTSRPTSGSLKTKQPEETRNSTAAFLPHRRIASSKPFKRYYHHRPRKPAAFKWLKCESSLCSLSIALASRLISLC